MVIPKTCQKLDDSLLFLEFEEEFTGHVILIANVNINRMFTDLEEWSFKHSILKTKANIIVQQTNDFGEIIIPATESRIDNNINYITDNMVSATYPEPMTGKTHGFVYGINI